MLFPSGVGVKASSCRYSRDWNNDFKRNAEQKKKHKLLERSDQSTTVT